MIDPIQAGMLFFQIAALGGLVWYCVETRRLRVAAQKQIVISQDLITAAMIQVEGLAKPCLTLDSALRDSADAIMGLGVAGNTVAAQNEGDFVVVNIGNGVALNVNFDLVYTGQYPDRFPKRNLRYLQNVLIGQRVNMLTPMNPYRTGQFEVVFHYESIGGRCYESRITMNGLVLAGFRFGTLAGRPDASGMTGGVQALDHCRDHLR
jgi:hypothetical protein